MMSGTGARIGAGVLVYGILGVMILVPFLSFLMMSLFSVDGVVIDRTPTLMNFERALSDPVIMGVFWRTIELCAGVAVVATLVAYPVALLLQSLRGTARFVLLIAITAPLVLSYVMKIYAFRSILGGNGLLNRLLVGLGVLSGPTDFFVFNLNAVFLVLTVLLAPFAVLPIFLSLEKIPGSLHEAAADLSAGRLHAFLTVTLPLSRPGIATALSFTFVMAIGDFVTPQMVGGPNGFTFGRIIYSQFGLAFNWPFGSALGVLLTIVVVLVLALAALAGRLPGGAGR